MKRFILGILVILLVVLLTPTSADAGFRWLWVPARAMIVDMAVQGVLTGHIRSDQTLMIGGLFLVSQAVRLPDVEVPGVRKVPLWMRHITLVGLEFAYSQHMNVRTRSIGRKYGRIFSDWAPQAPDQGENKPLGMTGYLDHNHVAMGFLTGALSRALFPEYREEVIVVTHQFLLFEGVCEAEHWDKKLGFIEVPWEYGDLISDLYGCQLFKEFRRR